MTTQATGESTAVHGGRLVARRLAAHGVTKLFTLSGGHLFSVYDGCREEGIEIVDVRHESCGAFAGESGAGGWGGAGGGGRRPARGGGGPPPRRRVATKRLGGFRFGAAEPLTDA